jgi:acyl-CoA synthetase (AMP-forming)/AMP-acid ligase II
MPLGGIGSAIAYTPDDLALTDGTVTLTWSQLVQVVSGVARRMYDQVDGSARVAVTGENSVYTVITHLAGILAGVGTVAVHRQATGAELVQQLADADCDVVVAGASAAAAAAEAVTHIPRVTAVVHTVPAPAGTMPWEIFRSNDDRDIDLAHRSARPLLVFTSGTTGRPSATPVHWAPAVTNALDYLLYLAAHSSYPAGAHLVVGPLQHNGPLTCLRHLVAGQPVIVMPRFDPSHALDLIEKHRVTSTMMVPTHFTRLLALDPAIRRGADVSSLRLVAHTGSVCPPDVKRAMIDWFGTVLVESYGGSELGTVARITSDQWLAHPGSVGQAVAPLSIAAYGADGSRLPAGAVGLLGVELTDGRTVEFVGNPDKSAQAHLRPGVATLGDVGYVDTDGFVYITDRATDMVISGGVNLYPAECEQILRSHADVADVAVIGIPDADLGEALHALIVTRGDTFDSAALDQYCRTALATPKCPRSYQRVVELVRNEMGKVDKKAMRRPYWASERTISG